MAKEKKAAKPQKKVIKKATKTKAKKKWVEIIGPKSFNNVFLGESLVESAERLIGKTVTSNLMHLNGDMRSQGVEIRFDVVKVQDGKGVTAVTGFQLLPSQMKRLVRRGRSKVDDSFVVRNSTGRLIRIKPVVFTSNRASRGTQSAIRLVVREKTKQLLQGMSFDKLVQELIAYNVQRALKDVASQFHPIRGAEIRACILLPEGTSEKREVKEDTREEDFVEVQAPESEAAAENEEEATLPDDADADDGDSDDGDADDADSDDGDADDADSDAEDAEAEPAEGDAPSDDDADEEPEKGSA